MTILAFVISGTLFFSFIAVFTYPLSKCHNFVIIGAMVGALVAIVHGLFDGSESMLLTAQLCTVIGTLIGATSLVWQAPMLMFFRMAIGQK